MDPFPAYHDQLDFETDFPVCLQLPTDLLFKPEITYNWSLKALGHSLLKQFDPLFAFRELVLDHNPTVNTFTFTMQVNQETRLLPKNIQYPSEYKMSYSQKAINISTN